MKIITQGRKIGRAVKNAQRLRQILSVFAKHGYNDVILRLNLGRFLPARIEAKLNESADITTQEHLRLALEELGPTFVKLGQLLSTRPDLIPESYIDELVKLQDNVQTISYEEVKEVIESEFGQSIHQTYQSFNPEPLASASIGQVHQQRYNL
jgi:ubiquinone biosynthesis protein